MKPRFVFTACSLSILSLITACSDDDPIIVNNPLNDSTHIDSVINAFITSNEVVGLSIATLKKTTDKTLIWSSQYGFKNRETQAPVDDETSFWLGSVSKAVMGATLMIANEKGFLQLDEDIHAILDNQGSFSLNNPDRHPVSIAQLASHTSGISDGDDYDCAYYLQTDDGDYEMAVPDKCPVKTPVSLPGYLGAYLDSDGVFYSQQNFLESLPGEEFEYSNIGAGLAGHMVELTTGQTLDIYAKQEVFTPLAMPHTSWSSKDLLMENIATPYATFENDDGEDSLQALPVYELATWPDGGLRSNATDLAQLLSVVMNKGQHPATGFRLLSETSVDRMLPAEGSSIGVFWEIDNDIPVTIDGEDRLLVGHTGSDPGAFSFMLFDPISQTGVVVIGNGDDETIAAVDLIELLENLFKSAATMQ